MIIMGIDPSLTNTGYAFISREGNRIRASEFGEIRTASRKPLPLRLAEIYSRISQLIQENRPDEVAVEEMFYAENPQSAMRMGYARGAVLIAAAHRGVPIAEYSAREVKMAVTGYGNASKEQVRRMVLSRVDLNGAEIGYDVSDAVAVALCHLQRKYGGL